MGHSALRISGGVRSQFSLQMYVFIVLLSFFDAIGVCGDDFHVVLATLLRTTDSDISAT